jgi:hypothetical protein
MLTVGLMVLIMLLGAVACAKRTPGGNASSSNGGGGGGSNTAASPTATKAAAATELTATIEAVGGSGVTGTADLVPGSPGTKITVELKGLPAGDHVAYIYHQSCEGSGERHGPLTAFTTEGDTSTSVTPFVSLALDHFASEPHFIVIQEGTSDAPGAAIACGEIKAAS